MADTSIFEVARQTHEEIERYVQAAVDALLEQSGDHPIEPEKVNLDRQHQISDVLDRIVSRYGALHSLYNDVTGDVRQELENLNKVNSDGTEEIFYERLGRLRDYHKRYPNAAPDVLSINLQSLDADEQSALSGRADVAGVTTIIDRLFSGEEVGGRFLDLYVYHDAFLNLKGIRRISYLQYIDSFDKLQGPSSRISDEAKRTDAYRRYLQNLQTYLMQFLRKTRPLADIDALELTTLADFEEKWERSQVPGWEDKGESSTRNVPEVASKQLTGNSSEGIWCEACKRSYAKQTVFDSHLKSPKHLKAVERLKKENGQEAGAIEASEAQEVERVKRQARSKAIARLETLVARLGSELDVVRAETRANVERKAALTERERQVEAEAATLDARLGQSSHPSGGHASGVASAADEEDDDGEKIYNPLKLPIGWDGKPIPFWLYKLHGLGVEYKCEICSDFVYQGRKNFERHFSESRHAFGMRALGLPNTKHFYEITRIEDALVLAEKLKRQGKSVAEEQGDAEEVEDEHGNTYTKKTYDLLKRQGLI